eukprot:12559215-Prorocentrum_lima.AAC.1
MTSSLVGSEMCIRDSSRGAPQKGVICHPARWLPHPGRLRSRSWLGGCSSCLLYTSDAADDM